MDKTLSVPSHILPGDVTDSTATGETTSRKSDVGMFTVPMASTDGHKTLGEEVAAPIQTSMQNLDDTVAKPSTRLEEIARLQLARIEEFAAGGRIGSRRHNVREKSDRDRDCQGSFGSEVKKQANVTTQKSNTEAESTVSSSTLISDTAAVEMSNNEWKLGSSVPERPPQTQGGESSTPVRARSSQPPRARSASDAKHVMRESLFDRDKHQEALSVLTDLNSEIQDRGSPEKHMKWWMKQGANATKESWSPYDNTINLFIASTLRLKEIGFMSETEILKHVAQAWESAIYTIPFEYRSSCRPEFIKASLHGRGSLIIQLRSRNSSESQEIKAYKNWFEQFCAPKTTLHWLYSIQVVDQAKRILKDTGLLSRVKVMDAMQAANGFEIYDLYLDGISSQSPRNDSLILKVKDREAANRMLSNGIMFEGYRYDVKVIDNPSLEICTQCAGYCHPSIMCTAPLACVKCGHDHRTSLCTSSERMCVNCWGRHAATDDICPIRQRIMSENRFLSNDEVLRLVGESRTWEADFVTPDSASPGPQPLPAKQDAASYDKPSGTQSLHTHTQETEPERTKSIDIKQVQVPTTSNSASQTRSKGEVGRENLHEWNEAAQKGPNDDLTEESWHALRDRMVRSQESFAKRWVTDAKTVPRQVLKLRSTKGKDNLFAKYIRTKEQPLIPIEEDKQPKWNEFPTNEPHLSQWWASDWNATEEDQEESLPVTVNRGSANHTYTHRFGRKTKRRPGDEQKESLL